MALKRGAELLGDIRHLGEFARAIMIDPAPELLGAHPRLIRRDANLHQPHAQLVPRQADERGQGQTGNVLGHRLL